MANELTGKRVAILLTDGFEQVEMVEPRKALLETGVKVDPVSPAQGRIQGFNQQQRKAS